MANIILFHGSEFNITMPEYSKGKTYNDYGQGFYCTEYADMAKEWAVAEGKNGISNRYLLSTDGLKILDLRKKVMRKMRKMTQKELALKSGINLRTLQQYESKARNINKASLESVYDIANSLHASIADLIEYF